MNLNAIIADLEQKIARNRNYVETVLADAKRAGRKNLTLAEDAECDRRLNEVDTDKAALARALKVRAEENDLESRLSETRSTGAYTNRQGRTATLSVTRNERTYNPGNDPKGTNFVRDIVRGQIMGDPEAQLRLSRHMTEERIERPQYEERAGGDLTSGAIGGVMVPQYLVDLTALAVANRRPFADACTKHTLPAEGMTFVIPVFTTGTAVGNQTTQLTTTGVGAQSMVESDLSLSVYTAAGYQNVSRQAADRSRVDEFALTDLMVRYASNLDSQLINMATVGLAAKAVGTAGAYADTQPTGAKLYPKMFAAAGAVEAALLGNNADMAVMHSRRFAWLAKEQTNTWPMINSQGIPEHASGVNYNKDYGSGYRGLLPGGLALVVDNNVPTNVGGAQDEIYVVASDECHLWEDPNAPAYIRAEQPNAASLGILLVVYGYYAFTFDRYGSGSMQKVGGTGLTTPAF